MLKLSEHAAINTTNAFCAVALCDAYRAYACSSSNGAFSSNFPLILKEKRNGGESKAYFLKNGPRDVFGCIARQEIVS